MKPHDGDLAVMVNGIDATSGKPLLPDLDPVDLAKLIGDSQRDRPFEQALAQRARSEDDHLGAGAYDAGNLGEVGWGVLVPEGTDPAIRTALKPLLDVRRAQAGERFKIFENVPKRQQWRGFLTSNGAPIRGVVDPDLVPYYLLIVGPPDSISWRFQRQLGMPHAVGRLDLPGPDEYRRYAENIDVAPPASNNRTTKLRLVSTRHAGDRATEWSATRLIAPLQKEFEAVEHFEVTATIGDGADVTAFQTALSSSGEPRLLFTASHGIGFPSGHSQQVAHQGDLLTSTWEQRRGPVDLERDVVGARAVREIDPSGLIALFVACFGAGTPAIDTFGELSSSKRISPSPFTAALPRGLLSHPGSPAAAVVSHVDRAWSTTFVGDRSESQTRTFASIIRHLARGLPIGAAMEEMTSVYAQAGAALAEALYRVARGRRAIPTEVNDLWLETADAGGYVILGDPASRLPIQPLDR
jgi:hypothetical protein